MSDRAPTDMTSALTSRFATDDERWNAVTRRNQAANGAFYYGVRTTGVYCLPSCPARPRRENVRFYATCTEAERAGFRACKRCRPNVDAPGGAP